MWLSYVTAVYPQGGILYQLYYPHGILLARRARWHCQSTSQATARRFRIASTQIWNLFGLIRKGTLV